MWQVFYVNDKIMFFLLKTKKARLTSVITELTACTTQNKTYCFDKFNIDCHDLNHWFIDRCRSVIVLLSLSTFLFASAVLSDCHRPVIFNLKIRLKTLIYFRRKWEGDLLIGMLNDVVQILFSSSLTLGFSKNILATLFSFSEYPVCRTQAENGKQV